MIAELAAVAETAAVTAETVGEVAEAGAESNVENSAPFSDSLRPSEGGTEQPKLKDGGDSGENKKFSESERPERSGIEQPELKNNNAETHETSSTESKTFESLEEKQGGRYADVFKEGEEDTKEVHHMSTIDDTHSTIELTPDEKIDKQNQVIESVGSGEKQLETTQEKGNYGEMKMDQDLRERGYERISTDMITDLNDAGHHGIDGVYYNLDGKPQYVIADAKYGTAQLSETADGKQMSENWIDKRLDEAVGKERADEIRLEKLLDSDNVGSYIAHVDEDGNVTYDRLDENATVIEKDVKL